MKPLTQLTATILEGNEIADRIYWTAKSRQNAINLYNGLKEHIREFGDTKYWRCLYADSLNGLQKEIKGFDREIKDYEFLLGED